MSTKFVCQFHIQVIEQNNVKPCVVLKSILSKRYSTHKLDCYLFKKKTFKMKEDSKIDCDVNNTYMYGST